MKSFTIKQFCFLGIIAVFLIVKAISASFPTPLHARIFSEKIELDHQEYAQASATNSQETYITKKEFMSEKILTGSSFSAVGLDWHEYVPKDTDIGIEMRFREKNARWSEWRSIPRDIDHKDDNDELRSLGGHSDSFLALNMATGYQYRIVLSGTGKATPVFSNLRITTLHAREYTAKNNTKILSGITTGITAEITQDVIPNTRVNIISRSAWGADESVRNYRGKEEIPPLVKLDHEYLEKFSDELQIVRKITSNERGELLTWPLEYPEKISKIIVHHTASTKTLDNPKQAIRDIYLWHALGRGWGDIGYNYILDPEGNIYEGRFGGEGVVGAHAGKSNTGSIGIAVLGNYEDDEVPEKVLISLAHLVSEKTKIHNIDPTGKSVFRGELNANILGHRDVMSTSCPGKNLYSKIPLLGQLARSAISTTTEPAAFKRQREAGLNYEDTSGILYAQLKPDQEKILPISIKNTGAVTWNKETSLVVNDYTAIDDFVQVVPPQNRATFPMAEPREIAPGQTATFNARLIGGFRSAPKTLQLMPVINGKTKLFKYISISTQTSPAIFSYELVDQKPLPKAIKTGERFTGWIDLKNTGNVNWQNRGSRIVRLGTDHPRDRRSVLSLQTPTRLATLQQAAVRPGEVGRFPFTVMAPNAPGGVTEYVTPVVEGITWMADKELKLQTFVYQKKFAATPISISRIESEPGKAVTAAIKLRNTGGTSWTKELVPTLKKAGPSRTKFISAKMEELLVEPGELATFTVTLSTPRSFRSDKVQLSAFMGATKLHDAPMTIVLKKTTPSKPTISSSSPSFSPLEPSSSSSAPPIVSPQNIRIRLGFSGTPIIKGTGPFTTENVSANITRYIPSSDTILRIENWSRSPEWDKTINDNEFRGILEVRTDESAPYVINELDIESYLKGLAETTNSDHMEKKKAIIIAARTYAYYYTTIAKGKKFPGRPYDLDDDPDHTQKYRGYGYEKRSPNSVKSVEETKGVVITYNGKVVITPYFSSSDGKTRSAQLLWGWTDTTYLISIDDPYCSGMKFAGHGVGMSGCGALGMAKNGSTYDEILKYYYKGVMLEKAY